jgi:response regulator NasT
MTSRVMLVDGTRARAALLEQALTDEGFEVVARVSPDENLLTQVSRLQPDIVLIDMDSPDRDVLEHMGSISREHPRPIVMFADDCDAGVIQAATRAGVSAYVVDGVHRKRLRPILEVAAARFREFQALRRELEETRSKLADRKDVDKAKGFLMRQRGLSEDEAYQALRKLAMDRGTKLGEAARNVLAVAALLEP